MQHSCDWKGYKTGLGVRVKATTPVFQLDFTNEGARHGYRHNFKPCRLLSDVPEPTFATEMNALILHAVHF